MHPPRSPAFGHGTISFLWGLGLGAFVWIGMVAVDVSQGTALPIGIVAGLAIFFFVRLFGDDRPRPQAGGSTDGRNR